MPTMKTNQEGNWKMNSIKYPCISPQGKDLVQVHPVWMDVSAYRRRGKVFIDSCSYCVSPAPNFIRVLKFICQRLPNSHTGLAIRTVWRKLCVLSIQSGLCCYSKNDARA